ncbi:unnamed protein product [Didymodactylos carnosus]|uniref:Uncharacterized protein n=1 Tax=Didymodactylos carnosus TaxID=1234261 RepID=A0A8S2CPE6_9BILA|nr:unnamed protein product [Didymodactylos carnosus]CAF3548704.1 unnamed protein product [Didymodactylos carnosus]
MFLTTTTKYGSTSHLKSSKLPSIAYKTRRLKKSQPMHSITSSQHSTRSSDRHHNTNIQSQQLSSNNVGDNDVSLLKEKYSDYLKWLKTNRKFDNELLKSSLAEFGIEPSQAEQLVSTCTWYVYQFQKEIGVENMEDNQKKNRKTIIRDHSDEQSLSRPKYNILPPIQVELQKSPIISNNISIKKFSDLPRIQYSSPLRATIDCEPLTSSRRVDFGTINQIQQHQHSLWKTAISKAKVLPKLRADTLTDITSTTDGMSNDGSSDFDPDKLSDLFSSQRLNQSQHQRSIQQVTPLKHGQTRSILRKYLQQTKSTQDDIDQIDNRIPLGTRSRKMFGGSEYFAQIMNELETQPSERITS